VFLKRLGLLGAATLALQYGLNEFLARSAASRLSTGGRSVSRTTGAPRHPVPSTCLMCPARCGIIGYLEDNILVKIEGNPKDPNSRGRICAKGLAGIQHLYNPDRVVVPLKRIGARGEDKWQEISWDEAITEIAARLAEIRSQSPEAFVFMNGEEGIDLITARFLRALGTTNGAPTVLDGRALYRANQETALKLTWGINSTVSDLAHTKYILNFGANPYETHEHYVPLISRLIEGRLSGAKLVTFDPRLSNTAGKSDEWFSIRPGTDAVVALAMANVIMQLGLYDRDFLEHWTNYSLTDLANHLRQYPPELAEAISGVKASHIRRIAIEFATTHPAVILSGGGVGQHQNGVQNERALMLLAAITGNIDQRGGNCLPRFYELTEPDPKPETPLRTLPGVQTAAILIKENKLKVGLLMTYRHNPAFAHPDTKLMLDVLKDEQLVPFYVAVDSYLTESAMLADIFLPAATYLESWDLHSVPAYSMIPFVGLMQPIVKPLGESKPFYEVCIELAKRIGGGMEQYFEFGSIESFLSEVISGIAGLQAAGGLDYLKENGVWLDPAAQPAYKAYEKEGFKTPSGKFEVHSEQLAQNGQEALPAYVPILEHQELIEGEAKLLILVTFQSSVQGHGPTANSMWLSEIRHDNPLWINKAIAEARGIKHGDLIKVSSSIGSIIARAHPTQGIHPNVVAIEGSLGHWAYGRIARALRFSNDNPNTRLIWWSEHGNGVHPYELIPIASDPIGGGQAWLDTVVEIAKVSEGGR